MMEREFVTPRHERNGWYGFRLAAKGCGGAGTTGAEDLTHPRRRMAPSERSRKRYSLRLRMHTRQAVKNDHRKDLVERLLSWGEAKA